LRVVIVPGSGDAQPTTLYDVVPNDANGFDVLQGAGGNLSNTTATQAAPGIAATVGANTTIRPIAVSDSLNLVVANAGDSKSGTVVAYLR